MKRCYYHSLLLTAEFEFPCLSVLLVRWIAFCPCIALIQPSQLTCLGRSVGEASVYLISIMSWVWITLEQLFFLWKESCSVFVLPCLIHTITMYTYTFQLTSIENYQATYWYCHCTCTMYTPHVSQLHCCPALYKALHQKQSEALHWQSQWLQATLTQLITQQPQVVTAQSLCIIHTYTLIYIYIYIHTLMHTCMHTHWY